MAGKPVARRGDVKATPGAKPFEGATSGTWTAGEVSVTAASPAVSSDGISVIVAAECTYSFAGTNGQSPVSGTSTVQLTAGNAGLRIGGKVPLLQGDSRTDSYGNTLAVSSAASLRTA